MFLDNQAVQCSWLDFKIFKLKKSEKIANATSTDAIPHLCTFQKMLVLNPPIRQIQE